MKAKRSEGRDIETAVILFDWPAEGRGNLRDGWGEKQIDEMSSEG